jgi:hypothetical protein
MLNLSMSFPYLYEILEVEAQGKIPLRFIVEETIHGPAGIHFYEIAQQG